MLNTKQIRLLRRNGAFEEPCPARIGFNWPIMASVGLMLVLMTIFLASCACAGNIPKVNRSSPPLTDQNAIKAIIGEGESETYLGKVALAYTIINRGTLKGVCAVNNVIIKNGKYYKRVSLKSKYYKRTGNRLRLIPKELVSAGKLAWEFAKNNPRGDWSATGWGTKEDIVIFKREGWFSKCIIVDKIGSHYFYKPKGA